MLKEYMLLIFCKMMHYLISTLFPADTDKPDNTHSLGGDVLNIMGSTFFSVKESKHFYHTISILLMLLLHCIFASSLFVSENIKMKYGGTGVAGETCTEL